MDLIPDAGQISQVMSQATGPAFVLGAVAAFIAVLLSRVECCYRPHTQPE